MLSIAPQLALYLFIPALALFLERRYRFFEWMGPVVFCYLFGMGMANLGGPVHDGVQWLIFSAPDALLTLIVDIFGGVVSGMAIWLPDALSWSVHAPTAKAVTEASIPLSIPLILFGSDFRAWLQQSRSTVVSFVCAVCAVTIVSTSAAWLFGAATEEYWKISGMLVGVYTGGTPNLMSIGMALEAREETFVLLNASDVLVSAFYLVFLLTFAKRVIGYLLPAFPMEEAEEAAEAEGVDQEDDFVWTDALASMAIAFGLSVAILAVSAGVTWLVAGKLAVAGVFLGLTTGGILGSLDDRIRGLAGSYELGNYLILIFCVAMGARTDFADLAAAGSTILFYTAFVVYGTILLHLLLSVLFRIDTDTFIITSTAAVFGPPFVPPVAEAMENRHVVLSGLTAGLVGYAVANYVGIGLAYLLHP